MLSLSFDVFPFLASPRFCTSKNEVSVLKSSANVIWDTFFVDVIDLLLFRGDVKIDFFVVVVEKLGDGKNFLSFW